MFSLKYDSPFRVGLGVFIAMPSAAGGKWGRYKLRISTEPDKRSFYDKLDALGVKLVMREVGE